MEASKADLVAREQYDEPIVRPCVRAQIVKGNVGKAYRKQASSVIAKLERIAAVLSYAVHGDNTDIQATPEESAEAIRIRLELEERGCVSL